MCHETEKLLAWAVNEVDCATLLIRTSVVSCLLQLIASNLPLALQVILVARAEALNEIIRVALPHCSEIRISDKDVGNLRRSIDIFQSNVIIPFTSESPFSRAPHNMQ
jgi:hypothetical protein